MFTRPRRAAANALLGADNRPLLAFADVPIIPVKGGVLLMVETDLTEVPSNLCVTEDDMTKRWRGNIIAVLARLFPRTSAGSPFRPCTDHLTTYWTRRSRRSSLPSSLRRTPTRDLARCYLVAWWIGYLRQRERDTVAGIAYSDLSSIAVRGVAEGG